MATPGKTNPDPDPNNQRSSNEPRQAARPEGVRKSTGGQQPQRSNRPPQQVPPQLRQQKAAFPRTNYQPGQPSQNPAAYSAPGNPGQQPHARPAPAPAQPVQAHQAHPNQAHPNQAHPNQAHPNQAPVPPGAGPAPVRVPGQESTSQSYSGLTEQTIGSPLMILEPASTMTRFYTRSGGVLGLMLFGVLGVLFPGLILGLQALIVADGSASSSILLKGFLFCFGVFWLPVGLIFGNYYLISTKTYLSVHQNGLFVRQAKYLFFNTSEFTLPFNQIDCIKVGFVRNKMTNASRMMMSKSKYEGIEELASADLNIFMLTGKRICVPGVAKMFTSNSVQRFYQSVSHFMR